jgi:hypothetical protein
MYPVQIIVMRSDEARDKKIGSLDDLEQLYPGLPEDMREFFRLYKVPVAFFFICTCIWTSSNLNYQPYYGET